MPNKSKLTETAVKRLRPSEKRQDIRDGGSTGLYLRVHPTGRKTWRMRYRYHDRPQILHLGEWPNLTLAKARATVLEHRQALAMGNDPAASEQKARAARRRTPTVAEFSHEYIERHARPNKRSWKEDQRILNREILPYIGKLRLDEVSRRDIVGVIDRIRDRGAQVMANRSYAAVRKMFSFAIERGILETTPAQHIRLTKEEERDIVLSDNAIRRLWAATATYESTQATTCMAPTTRVALRLLLITAQRNDQVCGIPLSELDMGRRLWELPADRTKNGLPHIVPLSDLALQTIDEAMALTADGSYLLASRGKSGRLTKSAPTHAMDRMFPVGPYTSHDLRRTATTGITSLGFSRFIAERVINHVDRTVGRTYDRYEYLDEKRDALDAWAAKLSKIVSTVSDSDTAHQPDG